MVIDIREDVPEMLEYVRQRVDAHLATVSKDKALPPVKMIEFGFEFGQGNWVALVFDTRPDAEPDGEWTRDIDRILLERPKWPIWHKLPDDAQVLAIGMRSEAG